MKEVMKYKTAHGSVTAIVGNPGRLYTPIIWIDTPITLRLIGHASVMAHGRPIEYPIKRAARTMLKAGRVLGITKKAKKFLRACL